MQIQHQEVKNKGAFFIEQEGEWVAEMTYSKHQPDKIFIDHTEVDENLQGQNVGTQLLQAAVEFARTNNLKIVPACDFAREMLQKKEEFSDVVSGE